MGSEGWGKKRMPLMGRVCLRELGHEGHLGVLKRYRPTRGKPGWYFWECTAHNQPSRFWGTHDDATYRL